jgi:hypothetical protein
MFAISGLVERHHAIAMTHRLSFECGLGIRPSGKAIWPN